MTMGPTPEEENQRLKEELRKEALKRDNERMKNELDRWRRP